MTFNGTYLFAAHWGVELLAALPFEHNINLNGGGAVAETKHLPPTLSLQYHFNPDDSWRPYMGAGLNYTPSAFPSVGASERRPRICARKES